MISLTELEAGKTGSVVEITCDGVVQQKLDTLGIRVGVKIKKLSSIMFGGPVVVQIGSLWRAKIAIGRGMANKIMIEVKN